MSDRIAAVKHGVSLLDLVRRQVQLRQRGNEWQGLCPFHEEKSASFSIVPDKGFYHCFGCGAHGDAIAFVRAVEGLDFVPALERLEAKIGGGTAVAHTPVKPDGNNVRTDKPAGNGGWIDSRRAAAIVWQAARPARGSLVEAFVRTRGLDPAANGLLDMVRFHPFCPAALWREWERPDAARRHAPAMLAPILRVEGWRGRRTISMVGVHLTFLEADGRKKRFEPWFDRDRKRHDPPSRMMWGDAARGAVLIPARPLNPAVPVKEALLALVDDVAAGELVVGEGLESTQSLMVRRPGCRIGCATLQLNNLQGSAEKDGPGGSIRLWQPTPADFSLPFTLTDPGRVVVGVDADMKAVKRLRLQERAREGYVVRDLTGPERAQLCGALASAHWRRAGAERVTVVRPPMGADFNDLDQRGGAA